MKYDSNPPWTVATIAADLGVPRHRVEYVVETRGLRPRAWAGHTRLFSADDVEQIRLELDRIRQDRREGGAL